MNLKNRKVIAKFVAPLFPSYGTCGRCGLPWSVCNGHITNYSPHQGCFPLCEDCWNETTIEERIPYYRQLYDRWLSSRESLNVKLNAKWEEIESAVLAGG